MVSAIGSSTYASPASNGKSSAGLETQLAQYQVKLADWVSCPSCKTPEGKAKIAEITNKIGDIKQRMEAAEAAKQRSAASETAANSPVGKSRDKAASASGANDSPDYGASAAPSQFSGAVGNRLDVFA